jgi:hypothetical protein
MEFIAGGFLRRAGLTLDEVFYFLPEEQIEDGAKVLSDLQALAADAAKMARRREALLRASQYMYLSAEDTDDVLNVSLGLLMAGEHQ